MTIDNPFKMPEGWTAEPGRAGRGFTLILTAPNGYAASVVKNRYSYGGHRGLYELAVLDSDGHLNYDTPVTSDVIGWLTPEGVEAHLQEIDALIPESVRRYKIDKRRKELEEQLAELQSELAALEA